jgi:ubiquinone/menaquinone biosynthesis C-methylase UbiE
MFFGSILRMFEYISATTADDQQVNFNNTYLSRLGFKLLGIPHFGLRLRARKIMQNIPHNVTSMLDAGFGTGVYSFTLADRVRTIDAIDIDGKKVHYAKNMNNNLFGNIQFRTADLTDLPFADSSYDLIICSDVLEHIKEDELAFYHLGRVLKKGGTLLITVPYDSKKNRITYKHYHHERPGYTESKMQDLCTKNGLVLEKAEGYSYLYADRVSDIGGTLFDKKIVLIVYFSVLYPLVIMSESLAVKQYPNGIFFRILKR